MARFDLVFFSIVPKCIPLSVRCIIRVIIYTLRSVLWVYRELRYLCFRFLIKSRLYSRQCLDRIS